MSSLLSSPLSSLLSMLGDVGVCTAWQESDASNRPYETVKPLAEQLGLPNPPLGDNNLDDLPPNGLVFNNVFTAQQHPVRPACNANAAYHTLQCVSCMRLCV